MKERTENDDEAQEIAAENVSEIVDRPRVSLLPVSRYPSSRMLEWWRVRSTRACVWIARAKPANHASRRRSLARTRGIYFREEFLSPLFNCYSITLFLPSRHPSNRKAVNKIPSRVRKVQMDRCSSFGATDIFRRYTHTHARARARVHTHIICIHILTEFEEHEFIVLDDAVEVVFGDHQDTILDLDFGETNRGEAKRRETKFADETPHADRNLSLFSYSGPGNILFSLLLVSSGEPSQNDTVGLVDADGAATTATTKRTGWQGRHRPRGARDE